MPQGAGVVRVVAGSYDGVNGPAKTFTPVNLSDVRLLAGSQMEIAVPEAHSTLLFVLSGNFQLASGETFGNAGLVIYDRKGNSVSIGALEVPHGLKRTAYGRVFSVSNSWPEPAQGNRRNDNQMLAD